MAEDVALGPALKSSGHQGVYLRQYLTYGEAAKDTRQVRRPAGRQYPLVIGHASAPESLQAVSSSRLTPSPRPPHPPATQVFREKWRVCRGWLQIFFTRNPMAMGGLSLGQRLVYLGACWAYVSHILAAPLMIAAPFIGAVLGVLPFELNRSFASAALVHTGAGYVIHMLCAKPQHIKNLWFASIAPQLFWYSYLHAAVSALFSTTGSRNTRKTNRRQPAGTPQGSESPPGFKATIDLSDLEETKDIYLIFTWVQVLAPDGCAAGHSGTAAAMA